MVLRPVRLPALLESFGHRILAQVDEQTHQGDSFLLFQRADGAYGLLQFGWGSCSGCDALQGCRSYREVAALRSSLHRSIEWYGLKAAVLEALRRDRSDQWYGRDDEWSDFVAKATSALV